MRTQFSFATSLIAFAAVFAAPGLAQDASSATDIDQVQLDDVWSNMLVEVPGETWEATSSSTAIGNTAATMVTRGDIYADVIQTLEGDVTSENTLLGGTTGLAVTTTTAYGNAATSSTWDGAHNSYTDQLVNGDLTASTRIELDGADTIATATTAIANVASSANEYGDKNDTQVQYLDGSVRAETEAVICCAGNIASYVTTAGGNAISSTGSTSTSIHQAEQFTASDETISAESRVFNTDVVDLISATTAFSNSATVHNEWGYATLGREGAPVLQNNGADTFSESYVTLDYWTGYASSSAYGVGNTASLSNIGSDTGLYVDQANFGNVVSIAGLNGIAGVDATGIVTATSIGNAASASLCNICGDAALGGSTQQYNGGTVTAQGLTFIGQNGSLHGSATAVGNTATYQSNGH